jgi:6-phosphogluconolactonase
LSLSKTRLLNSAVIYLHLVGPKKLTVLEQAMAGQDPLQMPVRAFLQQQQVPVHVMFTAN